MMNKQFNRLIVTLISVSLLAACQASPSAVEQPEQETMPIVIGASLPLSGDFAEPGSAAKNGYEAWATMLNESGGLLGRQIELRIVDNGSDPTVASNDYEELITTDKVHLVVGPFSSKLVIPTSEIAARHGYAFVEPAGGAPDVFNRGLNNIFFAQPGQSVRNADPFALHILSLSPEIRPDTFALVYQDDPFAVGVAERLKGLLTEGGLSLVYEFKYPSNTTDFSNIASEVAALDPDLIVGGTQLEDSIGQIKAYRAANYQPRMSYFTNGPTLPTPFKDALGPATEGIFSSISWFADAHEYENDKFVSKYIEMFGGTASDIPEDAANAFTVGQVLQQAVEKINSIDNAALIQELHRGSYKTIVGPLSFDETGAPQGSYMLLQWQGDKFVIVGPGNRAETDPKAPPKPNW